MKRKNLITQSENEVCASYEEEVSRDIKKFYRTTRRSGDIAAFLLANVNNLAARCRLHRAACTLSGARVRKRRIIIMQCRDLVTNEKIYTDLSRSF